MRRGWGCGREHKRTRGCKQSLVRSNVGGAGDEGRRGSHGSREELMGLKTGAWKEGKKASVVMYSRACMRWCVVCVIHVIG